MAIYLLAYDLVNESKGTFDYQPLWDELVEHFTKFVDKDDRLWVTSVRKGEHWYINAVGGTNKWLGNNPPT